MPPKKATQPKKKTKDNPVDKTTKYELKNKDETLPVSEKASDYSHLKMETEDIAELKKKYTNRDIHSNWAKYEDELANADASGVEDTPKTADFNFLLDISSSDCSHFQFREEKKWDEKYKGSKNNIFNLNLQLLSSGLSCIPFYELMGIDKECLTKEDIEICDDFADKSSMKYKAINKYEFVRTLSPQKAVDACVIPELSKTLPQALINKEETQHMRENNLLDHFASIELSAPISDTRKNTDSRSTVNTDHDLIHPDVKKTCANFDTLEVANSKTSLNLEPSTNKLSRQSENAQAIADDEDLEDWLDSMLDD